jgi:hypothetical protein
VLQGAALSLVAAQLARALGREADMAHDQNAGLNDGLDLGDHPNAAL